MRRAHRAAVAGLERERARGALGRERAYEREDAPPPLRDDRVVRALRERVQPGVERARHGLVVVRRRVLLGQRGDPLGHRADEDALEGRDGGVGVGVVAVEGVDVVAQPHAGVGELQPRGPRGLREGAGERAVGLEVLLEPEEPGGLALQARVDPARREPVVVVAGEHHELLVRAEPLADRGEERARDARPRRGARPRAARAPSPRITSRSTSSRASSSGSCRSGRRRRSRALAAAEVQVGDDEGLHA